MKITGIIAEYNPFHNGHAYHLRMAKQISGADYTLIIMSGDFVQRGHPALIDKYSRAEMALKAGADVVIELPLYYAAGSAEYFASGAVTMLHKLGVVDSVCFGSECGNLDILQKIAQVFNEEPPSFSRILKENLRSGQSYPLARKQALEICCPDLAGSTDLLNSPNNILGIEYLKTLFALESNITPYTTLRMGAGYHDKMSVSDFASALSIRESLKQSDTFELIQNQVPDFVQDYMKENLNHTFPIYENDISVLLKYKLLLEVENGYENYVDISKELSDKIKKNLNRFESFLQFCNLLKTKDMTFARISRCLLHILLDIKKESLQLFEQNGTILYGRLLGFRKDAACVLTQIKKKSAIPMITKMADASSILSPIALGMLDADIKASHIYDSVVTNKFGTCTANEYTHEIIRIE